MSETVRDPSAPGSVQADLEDALAACGDAESDEPVDIVAELEEIAAGLERAASRAVQILDGHLDDEALGSVLPLRLPKSRVIALGDCERFAVADARPDRRASEELSTPVLAGRALDVYVQHELAEGPVADPLEDLLSWLDATGEPDVRDQVIAAEGDLPLGALAGASRAWSSIDPAWWARTQGSASTHLAGGAVRCDGRTDVELGGPITGRPAVVVEVKRGRPHLGHLAEVTHYSLLVAMRDRALPALAARWYPGSPLASMQVTPAVLDSAARRLADAIGAWVEIKAGRPPSESPGPRCGWCPDADVCPSFQESPDPYDGADPGR